MNKLLVSAASIAATLCATQAIAGEYYVSDVYCAPRVAYYDTVVRYHSADVLAGYRTVATAYTVPVVTYKTYIRYHKVPVYSHVVYRTVHHYPVYADTTIYGDFPISDFYPRVGCCD